MQPILVRAVGDFYEVVDGAHRYECARDLRLAEVPVLVRELTDDEVLAAQVSANTQRIETLDAELAKRIWKISKRMSIEQIAYNMGKSLSWVKMVCGMEKLTPESLILFDQGKVTFRQAYLLSQIPRKHQEECWPLNEPELQHIIRQLKATGRLVDAPSISPMYRSLRQTISEMEQPVEAGRIILNETDGSPVEVWKAALRWVCQMDQKTIERRSKKMVHRESL